MKELLRAAEAMNTLGAFLGMRDVPALSRDALKAHTGREQADVMVLFGGSILAGGDVFADAMRAGVAKTYAVVGGAGHTTQTLRDTVHAAFPDIETDGLPEAEVYRRWLEHVYGLRPDLLETESTNCGNNITYLLALLQKKHIPCDTVILTQDASMQRRMDAGLRLAAPDTRIVNFAAYRAEYTVREGRLTTVSPIRGMWTPERYAELLLGEIPRLRDDEAGYGPRGKGFIAHVDIPEEVLRAYETLCECTGAATREANSAYASKG